MPYMNKNKLTFQNNQNKLKVPYVIYVDFDSLINKIERPTCDRHKVTPRRRLIAKTAFSPIYRRTVQRTYSTASLLSRNQCESTLSTAFTTRRSQDQRYHLKTKTLQMTLSDCLKHQRATNCHICDKPLLLDIY